jgi:hypothetical protein
MEVLHVVDFYRLFASILLNLLIFTTLFLIIKKYLNKTP